MKMATHLDGRSHRIQIEIKWQTATADWPESVFIILFGISCKECNRSPSYGSGWPHVRTVIIASLKERGLVWWYESTEDFCEWIISVKLDQFQKIAVILMKNLEPAENKGDRCWSGSRFHCCFYWEDCYIVFRQFLNFICQNLTYNRHCIHQDEEMNQKACEWLRENVGSTKYHHYSFFVSTVELLLWPHLPSFFPCSISLNWRLPSSGYIRVSSQSATIHLWAWDKKCCEAQKLVLENEHRESHQSPLQCANEEPRMRIKADKEKKKLIILWNTNEGEVWMWAEDDHPALFPRTKGWLHIVEKLIVAFIDFSFDAGRAWSS